MLRCTLNDNLWALLILGFGGIGRALRRRRAGLVA
jgi:hypothetical protein